MPLMLEIHGDTVSVDQYNTTLLSRFSLIIHNTFQQSLTYDLYMLLISPLFSHRIKLKKEEKKKLKETLKSKSDH